MIVGYFTLALCLFASAPDWASPSSHLPSSGETTPDNDLVKEDLPRPVEGPSEESGMPDPSDGPPSGVANDVREHSSPTLEMHGEDAPSDLELWGFDLQLDTVVVAASKRQEKVGRAAAVVTVVTHDEIRNRNYRTLADVLRKVPGFYDLYDLSTHNVGVRGINGGARASGSIIKLMIDGHPVDFRPSTANFFGEELIPIEVIERVEVIRGPASALYGADAFLGVVNIVTKSANDAKGLRTTARGTLIRDNPGGGGSVMIGEDGSRVSLLLAVSGFYLRRDGLGVDPQSSALNDPSQAARLRLRSKRDFAQPLSLFSKVSLKDFFSGKLEWQSSIQRLDNRAEFAEFGALSHQNRTALLNQNHRLSWTRSISDRLNISASGYYLNAQSTPEDRLNISARDFVLMRKVQAHGGGGSLEVQLNVLDSLSFTLGSDVRGEDHRLQSYDQILISDILTPTGDILRSRGTITPGDRVERKRGLVNVGGYVQSQWHNDWLSATGGLRLDYHNLYGLNVSGRVGLVSELGSALTLKALYGSSFKPPTAEQLFTSAATAGDILGNPNVKSQFAHNFELALVARLPDEWGEASINVFLADIVGRVAYLQRALFRSAQNILDEWVVGGELESRLKLARPVILSLSASVARTITREKSAFLAVLPPVTNELYPLLQVHSTLDVALPIADLKASVELSYIGPRAASQENALKRGGAYELPGYLYSAVSLSTTQTWLSERPTYLALRLENIPNLRWYEPGFGGIETPNLGINCSLTVSQQF